MELKKYKKQLILGALAVCTIGGVLTYNNKNTLANIELSKETIKYDKAIAMYIN